MSPTTFEMLVRRRTTPCSNTFQRMNRMLCCLLQRHTTLMFPTSPIKSDYSLQMMRHCPFGQMQQFVQLAALRNLYNVCAMAMHSRSERFGRARRPTTGATSWDFSWSAEREGLLRSITPKATSGVTSLFFLRLRFVRTSQSVSREWNRSLMTTAKN